MDRVIVWPGAIPLETDILNAQRNILVALGFLIADLLGTSTAVAGFPCTPGSGLNVQVGAGRIYSLQNLDSTAYSSLAADLGHQIMKQGILLDAVTLAVPAPAQSGDSIDYLIQAAYQDSDTDAVILDYFNAANPTQPFTGPNNTGTAQPTMRKGIVTVQAKAGAAAPTGTQTAPAADAGFTGLYVVTIANGAVSVVSGNITTAAGAPFIASPFGTQ